MQHRPTSRRFDARGYSAGRQAYDRRRRRQPLDAEGRLWRALVQRDPCSYCLAPPLSDADHIVPLSSAEGGVNLNVWDNLGGVCPRCNRSKGNKPMLIFMLDALSD